MIQIDFLLNMVLRSSLLSCHHIIVIFIVIFIVIETNGQTDNIRIYRCALQTNILRMVDLDLFKG